MGPPCVFERRGGALACTLRLGSSALWMGDASRPLPPLALPLERALTRSRHPSPLCGFGSPEVFRGPRRTWSLTEPLGLGALGRAVDARGRSLETASFPHIPPPLLAPPAAGRRAAPRAPPFFVHSSSTGIFQGFDGLVVRRPRGVRVSPFPSMFPLPAAPSRLGVVKVVAPVLGRAPPLLFPAGAPPTRGACCAPVGLTWFPLRGVECFPARWAIPRGRLGELLRGAAFGAIPAVSLPGSIWPLF